MSNFKEVQIPCAKCSKEYIFSVWTSVNAGDILIREKFLKQKLNLLYCTECDYNTKIEIPILYNDIKKQFAIWYSIQPYVPQNLKRKDYLFNAPVFNNWNEFLTELTLRESKIINTKIENMLLPVKIDFNKFDTFDDCLEEVSYQYNLNEKKCIKCNEIDNFFGLSATCSNCGKNIYQKSFNNTYATLILLKVVNHFFNEVQPQNLDLLIDKALFETLQNREIKSFINELNKIKVIVNKKIFILKIENSKIKIHLHEFLLENSQSFTSKPELLTSILISTTNYLNEYSKTSLFGKIRKIFK